MNIKKFCYGNQGPLILWGTYNFRENETEQTMETIRQQLPDAEYTVVAVEVDDWFRQFSPWPSDQLDSKFTGEAEKTWQWMEEYVLPECGVDAGQKDLYYGIFFGGAVCLVGFDGKVGFVRGNQLFRFVVVSGFYGKNPK